MNVKKLEDLDVTNQRVLMRLDLNVPIEDGRITSDVRIRSSLPGIKMALDGGAAVILMSHLGRPVEGEFDDYYSLQPVAVRLSELLNMPVRFEPQWLDGLDIKAGEVVLCGNVRFNPGEKADNDALARKMAKLCDVFVMDAFGTAHRAQASTHGVALHAPVACAGPLLSAELKALSAALEQPKRPMAAIVGGAKVSTKLTVLETLLDSVDKLIVGGGIANTFIAAAGHNVGKSLYEKNMVSDAKRLMERAAEKGSEIPIPTDVVVAKEFAAHAKATVKPVSEVEDDDMILDVGPETARSLAAMMRDAGTIVWNGPLGVFEIEQFSHGTQVLGEAIAASDAFSIAGGGDTVAAVDKYHLSDRISYISTGGGAFLEFLEGKQLPAVVALEQRAND